MSANFYIYMTYLTSHIILINIRGIQKINHTTQLYNIPNVTLIIYEEHTAVGFHSNDKINCF